MTYLIKFVYQKPQEAYVTKIFQLKIKTKKKKSRLEQKSMITTTI